MRNKDNFIQKILKNANTKILAVPILTTIALFVVFLTVIINGTNIVRSQYEALAKERVRLARLENKLSILRNVQNDQLSQSETAVIALPSGNPSLWMMSQIKNLASQESIILKDTKMGHQTQEKEDIQRAAIEIISKGDIASTLSFIENLGTLAPINSIESIFARSGGNEIIATTKITIYWSPLPKTLPEISEPINNLSQEELQLLASLSKLKKPIFTSKVPDTSSAKGSNPFQQ